MINKGKFSNIYSPKVINDIVEKNEKVFYHDSAYRMIKHSKTKQTTKEDFYPTIMEYNNPQFTMPNYFIQDRKNNLDQFSTSCFDSRENLEQFIQSITSIREDYEKNGWFILSGRVNADKGFADEPMKSGPKKGHFNYFLYDPIGDSPLDDFTGKKEGKNE